MAATLSPPAPPHHSPHSPHSPPSAHLLSQLAPWTRTLARLDAIHSTALRREQLRRTHPQRTSSSQSVPTRSTVRVPALVRTMSTGVGVELCADDEEKAASSSSSFSSSFSSSSSAPSSSSSCAPPPMKKARITSTPRKRTGRESGKTIRTSPARSRTDPLHLPLPLISHLITYLDPSDILRLQTVSKTWRTVLASEHMYTVAVLAHFGGTEEAEEVRRRHEGGERFPECARGAWGRCMRRERKKDEGRR